MNAVTENKTTNKINGIDVDALQEAIDMVRANPVAGQTRWDISSRWTGGTRSDHAVDGLYIGGHKIDRRFVISIDEPLELCGTNQYANPQEYLLAATNACMIVGYVAIAALMGVKLTHLEIHTCGDIDLQGFFGLDLAVVPGYESLQQTVTIAGDGTPDQFREIHERVKQTSPNYFNITHAIGLHSRLEIQ